MRFQVKTSNAVAAAVLSAVHFLCRAVLSAIPLSFFAAPSSSLYALRLPTHKQAMRASLGCGCT
ncbi:hypothetical protein PF005_g21606 [Phytophthora fragariae]|uniref:Uncharacterized protein n=1 Tax=Phytophthora fragariae TaxID=53985 RepID=A0A6A4CCS4_9STRA|nr:hypothetical protein PF009_g12728 [Phytophthora fragariae]KAE8996273.1 hypothetical protein PF011_g15972 [Phytophthora fragariae]KAE9095714.1 hypothetical protein PF010_g16608 [Phytophthora fragariae]KAE9109556.1 hypothetical protein PF007_g12201 [Phytophthora fragariae]KAE9129293.1 hypothetical protein PF006_g16052 [Phytophthora fragariae]